MKKIITLAAFLAAPSLVSAQTAYLCMPNGASGISWNASTKKWGHANFNVKNIKYLLKKTDAGWEWSTFGKSFSQKCGEISASGILDCAIIGGQLRFNKQNLRYLNTYIYGYIDGGDNNDNTPGIEFGECSPL